MYRPGSSHQSTLRSRLIANVSPFPNACMSKQSSNLIGRCLRGTPSNHSACSTDSAHHRVPGTKHLRQHLISPLCWDSLSGSKHTANADRANTLQRPGIPPIIRGVVALISHFGVVHFGLQHYHRIIRSRCCRCGPGNTFVAKSARFHFVSTHATDMVCAA